MNKKHRLLGIDLLKGIAAYAVVYAHSSGGLYGVTDYWAAKMGYFCTGFAVPFFLATSFYLMIKKVFFSESPYLFKSRVKFIVITYFIWTLIYLVFRGAKYFFTGDLQKIQNLFTDPISIIFLGGAAVQLYFLPLLISGIIVAYFTKVLLPKEKVKLELIILLLFASTLGYEIISSSGNAFHLGSNVAFENLINSTIPNLNNNQIIRVLLVYLSWILRCLPYIFAAMLLNHPLVNNNFVRFNGISTIVFLLLVFLINGSVVFGKSILPYFVNELLIAYFSLLFSISLSSQMAENVLIKNLGLCSFGIYLTHHLLIDAVRPIVYKLYPGSISLFTVSTCAVISFLLSWITVFYLRKSQKISHILFGG